MLSITEDQSHIKKIRLSWMSIFQAQISLKIWLNLLSCASIINQHNHLHMLISKAKILLNHNSHTIIIIINNFFSYIILYHFNWSKELVMQNIYTCTHQCKIHTKFPKLCTQIENKTTIMPRHMQKYSNSPTLKVDIVFNVQNRKQ